MTSYDNNDILSCRCGIKVEHMLLFAYDINDKVVNKKYYYTFIIIYIKTNKFNKYKNTRKAINKLK